MNLFNCNDYKTYLTYRIKADSAKIPAYRKKLALAAGCKQSYLSKILNENIDLTLDHAWGICDFWHLTDEETDFFLLLVNIARAASKKYRNKLLLDKKQKKQKQKQISTHVKSTNENKKAVSDIYYRNWIFSAIHILITIEKYQYSSEIASRLCQPEKLINQCLSKLEAIGLVKKHPKNASRWIANNTNIHLENNAFSAINYHQQWRQQAINDILNNSIQPTQNIHYTSIQSVSINDIEKIRETLFQSIVDTQKLVKNSKEEEIICTNIDLFIPKQFF